MLTGSAIVCPPILLDGKCAVGGRRTAAGTGWERRALEKVKRNEN